MAGLLVAGGENFGLQYLVGAAAVQGLTLKLFQNNYTPVIGDVVGNYTEATFTGYSAKVLTPATWVLSGSNPAQITYPQQAFLSSADQAVQAIYGYYLIRTSGGELIAAERFATPPINIQFNGDTINITPKITLL